MPSAGQMLRSERLKRNKSVSEISAETRITARYLEAIEADDLSQLPGDFFYKAFLRQYARSLDLDGPTTDRILASAVPTREVDPLPAMNEVFANASVGAPTGWAPPTSVAIGLLVAVVAGGSALYAWWQNSQAQKEATSLETSVQAASQPQPEVRKQEAPQERADKSEPAAAPSNPTTAAPAPANTVSPLPQSGDVGILLTATEPTWVQLSSGGKTVFIGTLQANDPHQFAIGESGKLLTGNAGALEVSMNGKPIGSLGPKGQIRTVYFTGTSFEIAGPKPKPVPTTDALPNTASVAQQPTAVDH